MVAHDDVICISSIDWDFIWQGHQEIMSAFAARGHRVLFIENTGVRAPRLRDLPRVRQRLRNWFRGTKGFRQERENLVVYSPLILPFPYSRLAGRINRLLLLRALDRWMRTTGFRPAVIWTFLPTPLARDVIHAVDPELVIYYCIDDLASSSAAARKIRQSETRLFQEADLVFVTSEKLRQRAAQQNAQVAVFPFGVDFERFARVHQGADESPRDVRALPRPVVGYVGGVHQWVDQPLLEHAARSLPEISFVFVGPCQTNVSSLARYPNVHLLGARPHETVPGYIKGFDLGLIPYELTEYTANVYPTKLNEYLAMGIPVVSTDLPEIRRFNADFCDVVAVAGDADGFIRKIQEALKGDSPDARRRRIDIARQNSWQARIAQMTQRMDEALLARRAARVSWEQKLRRVYRTTRRRVVRLATAVAIVYLVCFRSPLLWWAASPLRLVQPARPADAIVVLAGGVGESGKAGQGYQERVKQAVDLYNAGMTPWLVFSSGYTAVFQETEVMRELAVAHGVPASAIVIDTQAASTIDQVRGVRTILNDHGWRTILLVSSPYHMRRALWTFRKLVPALAVIPSPGPRSDFYARGPTVRLEQIVGIFHEYLGILYYWLRGWM